MRCEARFRATQVRASRAKGTSCGPRTGTRLATDGGPGTVTLTACHFPGGKPGPAVYEAIDHDLFKSGDAAAARAQVAKYGITKPFVVFVSSLWAYKNHGGLLRAWARARPQLRGRQLVFVGAGPDSYAAELRSLAAELGIGDDLIFTGGVSLVETVAFYRVADLLAYPSHNETFGLPILEARACGCPVVTSQVSSMPEIADGAAIPPILPPSPRPWWLG